MNQMKLALCTVVVAAAACVVVAGCTEGGDTSDPQWMQFKWGRRDVPKTQPSEVTHADEAIAPGPPSEAADRRPVAPPVEEIDPEEQWDPALRRAEPVAEPTGESRRRTRALRHPRQLPSGPPPPTRRVPAPPPPAAEDDVSDAVEEALRRRRGSTPVYERDEMPDRPAADHGRLLDDRKDDEPAPETPPAESAAAGGDDGAPTEDDEITIGPVGGRHDELPERGEEALVAASMVQINDRFITVDDVLRRLHRDFAIMTPPDTEADFKRQAAGMITRELRRQVTEALVLIRAEKELTDSQSDMIDKEIDRTLHEMIAQVGGSRTALAEEYRRRHTTLEDVLADQRKQMIVQWYLQKRIQPAIVINRQMLLNYYRQHESEFCEPRKVQMQIIAAPFKAFLPADGPAPTPLEWEAARTRAKEEIDKAAAEVVDGKEFGQVARRYSRGIKRAAGGVWPLLSEGSFLEKEVERNAIRLRPGQICGIIESENGYYIVKALQVIPGKTVTFEKAQKQIEGILREQQFGELSNKYFTKLLKEATMAESPEFMAMALQRAVDRYWQP
ncbi:MAG: peptidylprolyl isomerase [Planctomycetota bacterium]|jgi:parvulin-like peptidyl-prolyl isomerase